MMPHETEGKILSTIGKIDQDQVLVRWLRTFETVRSATNGPLGIDSFDEEPND